MYGLVLQMPSVSCMLKRIHFRPYTSRRLVLQSVYKSGPSTPPTSTSNFAGSLQILTPNPNTSTGWRLVGKPRSGAAQAHEVAEDEAGACYGRRVQCSVFRVQGPGSRVQGPGFRVWGLGFRVWGTQKAHKLFKSLARGVETAYSVSTLARLETLTHEI